ncbi:hypothetical protein [Mesobacillus zeae]|uniref:hypothetical protein n=1 Tax=Mesobacillus zeae TaxID=1917180 RepID=UPI0015E78905|nr:hypothetical protein [Mesobacillus zeae]
MNWNFGKREKLILAGSLPLSLFLYLAFYLSYIKPLDQELERKEKEMTSEKRILEGLEKKSRNTKRRIVRGIGEMQSRLPVAPLFLRSS